MSLYVLLRERESEIDSIGACVLLREGESRVRVYVKGISMTSRVCLFVINV